mmetsp:Transcript_73579/g.132551  ORF Transcript_73579/g.132551 Transcript_73579/m.132551 type:complete len:213 (-) Transcript_73579:132-770(-)
MRSRSFSGTASHLSSSSKRRSMTCNAFSAVRSLSTPDSWAFVSSSLNASLPLRLVAAWTFWRSLSIFFARASNNSFRSFCPVTAVKRESCMSFGSHFSYLSKGFTPFSRRSCLKLRSFSFSRATSCSIATCFSRSSALSALVGFAGSASAASSSSCAAIWAAIWAAMSSVSAPPFSGASGSAAPSTPSNSATSLAISGGQVQAVNFFFLWKK